MDWGGFWLRMKIEKREGREWKRLTNRDRWGGRKQQGRGMKKSIRGGKGIQGGRRSGVRRGHGENGGGGETQFRMLVIGKQVGNRVQRKNAR